MGSRCFSRGHVLSDIASDRYSRGVRRKYMDLKVVKKKKRVKKGILKAFAFVSLILLALLAFVLSLLLF